MTATKQIKQKDVNPMISQEYITLDEFAAMSGLEPAREIEMLYNLLIKRNLNPANFYVVRQARTKDKYSYYLVAKYNFILSLIMDKIDYIEVDVINHDIMDEVAVAVIKRKGYEKPFVWHLPKSSYSVYNPHSQHNYYFMLRKACIVQAARFIFADVFDSLGLPMYVQEELYMMDYNSSQVDNLVNTDEQNNQSNNTNKADKLNQIGSGKTSNSPRDNDNNNGSSPDKELYSDNISLRYDRLAERASRAGVDFEQLVSNLINMLTRNSDISYEQLNVVKKKEVLDYVEKYLEKRIAEEEKNIFEVEDTSFQI
ncbi:MAG: hypothetical protein QXF12_06260 [Candidatus Aenigmatarchaeota archaeon]